MFLPHFDVICDLLLNRRTATWNLLFYIITKQTTTDKALFISKSFNITRKPAFAHFGEHEKKPFDVIYYLYKLKQSHWLLCVAKNCDWSRKITPLSIKLESSAACRGMGFVTNNIFHRVRLTMFMKGAETAQYGLEIIFKTL